jgi:anthranilate synthase/aminodeoxychorismate synthase-like glutamine amidotransferase
MTRVLLIDNYDSFTYNIVQAIEIAGTVVVVKTNELTVAEARDIEATHLVISPGPGRPEHAGNTTSLIEAFANDVPILGVCLGHQALATVMGGTVEGAKRLLHGKSSQIYHDNKTIYEGLPNPFIAGRYHSLIVAEDALPRDLEISSYTSQGEIMGIRHKTLPLEGVQFHPESVLTPEGSRVLGNFLDINVEVPA